MNQYDSDYKDIDNLYRRKDIKNSKRKGENMNIEDKVNLRRMKSEKYSGTGKLLKRTLLMRVDGNFLLK